MPSPVDYDLAVRTAARLAPRGPDVGWQVAADAVTQLRELTVQAEEHVRAVTGLHGQPGPATVVDRPGWAAANVDGLRVVLEPLTETLAAGQPRALLAGTAKLTGLQLGSVLAWLSSKVLGQYEAFQPEGQAGRLILVAPNIVETERRLGVDPRDFRLWVALHEVTHRTQFTAVPWLHAHVREEVRALLKASSLDDPQALAERLRALLSGPRGSLVEMLQTPEQKQVMDRVTAFMSLLEGHAEHVMDGVGPSVVPTVAHIRARFDARRRERGSAVDRVLRRLLGLDLKAQQYAEGSAFVRGCVDAVGMAGFNRVWEGPQLLPTREEIRRPADWVARVHGVAAHA